MRPRTSAPPPTRRKSRSSVDIAHQVAEFLIDGTIRQAVNIPALSTKELEILGPHLTLGEKLGRLAAQLITDAPTELTLAFGGEAANLKPDAVTAAVLKGLMSGFLAEDLNYVNAPFIARERGIKIIETRSREITDYVNTLTLTVRTGAGEHEVSGRSVGKSRAASDPDRRLPRRVGARGLLPDAA